jgi:hypothetical protein
MKQAVAWEMKARVGLAEGNSALTQECVAGYHSGAVCTLQKNRLKGGCGQD